MDFNGIMGLRLNLKDIYHEKKRKNGLENQSQGNGYRIR